VPAARRALPLKNLGRAAWWPFQQRRFFTKRVKCRFPADEMPGVFDGFDEVMSRRSIFDAAHRAQTKPKSTDLSA